MEPTLVIGIAIVIVGTALAALMMFGHRANPLANSTTVTSSSLGTIPPTSETPSTQLGGPSGTAEVTIIRVGPKRGARGDRKDRGDVRIRWYQRLRSLIILMLITVGIGMTIGALVGVVALAVSLLLG